MSGRRIEFLFSILILSFGILLSGCFQVFNYEEAAISSVNDSEISYNDEIRLSRSIDGDTNEYKLYSKSSGLYLEIDNFTSKTIEFEPDYDVEIYLYDESETVWKIINNNVEYSPGVRNLSPQSVKYYFPALVLIYPELPLDLGIFDTVRVRVIVKGRLMGEDNSVEKMVGATIEIELRIDEKGIENLSDI